MPAAPGRSRVSSPTSRARARAPKAAVPVPNASNGAAAPESPKRKAADARPIRPSLFSAERAVRSTLETLRAEPVTRAAAPRKDRKPVHKKPIPFARKPVFQELESRLLLSADLNPVAQETLFATPALQGAEYRALVEPASEPVVTSMQVAPIQRTNEVVFVDMATSEYQALVDDMRDTAAAQGRNLEFVLIDADKDGVRKITDTLAQRSDLDAIHIVSHARDGAVQLGSTQLDVEVLFQRSAAIKTWGKALVENGDILIYGCDLAGSQQGKSLVDALARLTRADVAASEDLTGSADQGGNWKLEFTTGNIEATAFASAEALAGYGGLLALPLVDLNTPTPFIASDNFATQGYTGGTGWTSGWTEFDASPDGGGDSNNSPTGKNVQLQAAGGNFEAVFFGHPTQVPRDYLQRSLNLLPYTSATLSFTYRMQNVEAGDTVSVEVSTNGGATFTVVDVLPTVTTNTARTFDISGLISDRMVIRFGPVTGFTDADDRFFFDNVVVTADGNNYDASYVEDGTTIAIGAATTTVTDPDGGQIQSAIVTVANVQAGDLLTPGALPGGIVASGAGTSITLTGLASAVDYATAIRNITYSTTSDTPNTKIVRQVTVRVTDASSEQSNPATAFIRVANADDPMNAAPDAFSVASFGSFSGNVLADNGAGPDTDPDGILSVTTALVSGPSNGTVTMNADGTFTYTPNAGVIGTDFTDTFQYRLESLSQVPGVTYQFWDTVPTGNNLLTGFPTTAPNLTGFQATYDVDGPALLFGGTSPLDNFTVRFSSEIEITTGGTYTFYSGSDDGSIVRVNGVVVVNNDGAHSFQERSGAIFLAPGRYVLTVDFFEIGGQEDLQVLYSGPDTGGARNDLSGAVGLLASTFDTGTVTVNGYAAAPRLDLDGNVAGTGYATTWTDPPGTAQAIADTDVTITDSNSANLTGATVTLTNAQAGDVLIAGAMPGGLTASVSGNVVTLSGTASLAAYQAAIRAISFDNTAANPATLTRAVNVVVNDGTYDSNTAVATITVVSPNDAPIAVGETVNALQNVPITFDVRTNDSDPESQPLSVTQINGTAIAVGGAVGITGGTITRNADGTLTFTPTAGYSGASTFTYTVSDGVLTATATVNLNVNAPPALDLDASGAGTGYTTTFAEFGAAVQVVDTDSAITDPNAGDSITFARLTLLNAQAGDALSVAGALPTGITANFAGNVLTLSGTSSRANYETALEAVRFSNPGSTAGTPRSVQVLVYDGASYSNAATATINVAATNDPPVNAVPGVQTTLEDASIAITGVSVADVDNNLATSRITVTNGTASVSLAAGATISAGANGSTTFTLSGTQAQINVALATLSYQPTVNFSGTATLTVLSTDANVATDSDVVNITVTAVNDAPAGTNATLTFNEDTTYTFSAANFGFTDPNDTPLNTLQAVIITTLPGAGTLSLSGTPVTAGQVIPAASIGNLTFTPASNGNGAGYASFTFQVRDNGGTANGGQDTDQTPNTITFNVTAVNDPPVNSVPSAQTTPVNTALGFGAALGNALSVADVDGGALTVTLAVTNGTLTLATTAGLTFTTGDGIADATMTFSGTAAVINAALDGVFYSPNAAYVGPATLSLTTSDGTASDVDTVAITVTSARPRLDLDDSSASQTVSDNLTSVTYAGASGGAIPWSGDWFENDAGDVSQSPALGDVQVADTPAAGTNNALRLGDASGSGGTIALRASVARAVNLANYVNASLTFNQAQTNLEAADTYVVEVSIDGGTSYTTLASFAGNATTGRTVILSGYESAGTVVRFRLTNDFQANELLFIDNVVITAEPTGYATAYTENAAGVAVADTDILITDVDSTTLSGATITLTTPQAGDLLTAGAMPGGITATVTGNVVTLSGSATLAAYQTAIQAVRFSNSTDNPSTVNRAITVVLQDDFGVSSNVATTTVTVTAVNDAPVITDATVAINENSANGTVVYDVNDGGNDTDADGQALTYTITAGNGAGGFAINAATGVISVANSAVLDYETTTSFVLTVQASDGTLSAGGQRPELQLRREPHRRGHRGQPGVQRQRRGHRLQFHHHRHPAQRRRLLPDQQQRHHHPHRGRRGGRGQRLRDRPQQLRALGQRGGRRRQRRHRQHHAHRHRPRRYGAGGQRPELQLRREPHRRGHRGQPGVQRQRRGHRL